MFQGPSLTSFTGSQYSRRNSCCHQLIVRLTVTLRQRTCFINLWILSICHTTQRIVGTEIIYIYIYILPNLLFEVFYCEIKWIWKNVQNDTLQPNVLSQSEHCNYYTVQNIQYCQPLRGPLSSACPLPIVYLPFSSKETITLIFFDNLFIGFLYSLIIWACIPTYHSLVFWANNEKMFNLTSNQENAN